MPSTTRAIKACFGMCKTRKADHGISKSESKAILKQTGVFVPVGSGKYTFRAYFSVF